MSSVRNEMYYNLLIRNDFESKLEKLKRASCSQRPSVCAELCDMLKAHGIICETGKDNSYYEKIIKNSSLPEFIDAEKSIIKTMFNGFNDYPKPEDYMLRIVNRLSEKEDSDWKDDPLRLRILKQFIKYTDCLTYKADNKKVHVYNGEAYLKRYSVVKKGCPLKKGESIWDYIQDDVFNVLETATKAQKKPNGTYGILKLADDLAHGIFKAGGATKRDLYMFAIAYDMTYSISSAPLETDLMFDYESDIEKNLFIDYYSNNLMRFTTEAYEKNLSAFELDPSERGINYKNFAEIVYIYYISKKYSPVDKLKLADEMIGRLKNSTKKKNYDDDSTQYYYNIFIDELLGKTEQEFEEFIAENYDCNVEFESIDQNGNKRIDKKSEFQVNASNETAFYLYKKLISDMEKEAPYDPSYLRENCNYGLWFVDVSAFNKLGTDNIENLLEKISAENNEMTDHVKIKKFIRLLYSINMFLGHLFVENKSNRSEESEHTKTSVIANKKMMINNSEEMTRTALIIAYYYRYNHFNELNGDHKSFIDVMDDYTDDTEGLNSLLEASGYQLINDKNIFDMAVIFSSYAYLAY